MDSLTRIYQWKHLNKVFKLKNNFVTWTVSMNSLSSGQSNAVWLKKNWNHSKTLLENILAQRDWA